MLFAILLSACSPHPSREPAPDAAVCAEGEALDGETCVPEACGIGTWGTLPVDGSAVYVDIAAAEGGDGSEAAPFASIQAGVDLAGDRGGGLVAVAAGTYVDPISMGGAHDGVTLAGRCRELVTVDRTGGGDVPGIEVSGSRKPPSIGIEGLTVIGSEYSGLWLQRAVVSVTRTDLHDNSIVGVVATEAEVTLDDVGVYGSKPDRHGDFGQGIQAVDASTLTVTGSTLQGNSDTGVVTSGTGATVDLVDTAILDTLPLSDGTGGVGLWAEYGAAITATRCTVQGNSDAGVMALDAGTTVDIVDSRVLDTLPLPDGTAEGGVVVRYGAALALTGSTIERSTMVGLYVSSAGTTVDVVDSQILDATLEGTGLFGRGIEVNDGAALTLTACTIRGNPDTGIYATGAGTFVDLVDTEILDATGLDDGTRGSGIEIASGASLSATRCTIDGNAGLGLLADGAGTTVGLVDTDVSNSGADGIDVQGGASLAATGCTVERNTEFGMLVLDTGTAVDLVATEVLDTSPDPVIGHGRGIEVQGAALTATDCTIRGNTQMGVFAATEEANVELVDSRVLETRRNRDTGFAIGVAADYGCQVSLRRTEIADTDGPGIYVLGGARIEFDQGSLTGNTFAGALVLNGSVSFTATTITDTVPDDEWGGGFGIYTHDYQGPAAVTLLDSTIGPHAYAAVWLDDPGTYDIERNALSGSPGVASGSHTLHGNALFAENGVTAWNGRSGLLLADNTFSGSAEISVLLDGSSATLSGNTWSDNGTDVRQQACDGPDGIVGPDESGVDDDVPPLTEADLVDVRDAMVCPGDNVLTAYDLAFTSLYLAISDTE